MVKLELLELEDHRKTPPTAQTQNGILVFAVEVLPVLNHLVMVFEMEDKKILLLNTLV